MRKYSMAMLIVLLLTLTGNVSSQSRVVTDIDVDLNGDIIQVNDVYTLGVETERDFQGNSTCLYLRRTIAPSHRVHQCFEPSVIDSISGQIQQEGLDITILLYIDRRGGLGKLDYNCSISLPAATADEGAPSISCYHIG